MLRNCFMKAAFLFGIAAVLHVAALAQDGGVLNPASTRGPNPLMTGVFVTPVPNAPFSATAQLQSTRALQDGTTENFKTINNIARDSGGRIYNEHRQLVPANLTGTPQLLSSHIYDPETRRNTFLNPMQHIARQSTLQGPGPDWGQIPTLPILPAGNNRNPNVRQEDLGTQVMENLVVHGKRVIRTVPAAVSGTGQPLVITDEYWYSDDLHLNMLIKHNDPRTGEQTLTITQLKRGDPDPQLFKVPSDFKLVDETPGTEANN